MDDSNALWTKGVIEHNQRWLLAYLYAATGDRPLAEDLVQETFVVAFQKRNEIGAVPSFGAWLRGVAKNVLLRYREKHSREPVLVDFKLIENWQEPAAALEQAHLNPEYEEQRILVLRNCVQKLTQKARLLIEGRYQENLNIEQLAERSGLTPGSVPVILHRARMALFDCITKKLSLAGHEHSERHA